MNADVQRLDRSALKVNQLGIIVFSLAGFILGLPVLTAFVAAVLLAGTIDRRLALFKQTYHHVLKPLKLLAPEPAEEVRASHEFAQLLGGLFLLASSVFLFLGWPVTGWILTWIVVLLAATNLFFGFCTGCFVYFQLRKHGIPGFTPSESRS